MALPSSFSSLVGVLHRTHAGPWQSGGNYYVVTGRTTTGEIHVRKNTDPTTNNWNLTDDGNNPTDPATLSGYVGLTHVSRCPGILGSLADVLFSEC